MSTGCSNSSILKCKCPFIRHSSGKCLFEIVGHALRILSEASIPILQRWGQYVKGEWKWCPCDDFKIGRLFPPKISKKNSWKLHQIQLTHNSKETKFDEYREFASNLRIIRIIMDLRWNFEYMNLVIFHMTFAASWPISRMRIRFESSAIL